MTTIRLSENELKNIIKEALTRQQRKTANSKVGDYASDYQISRDNIYHGDSKSIEAVQGVNDFQSLIDSYTNSINFIKSDINYLRRRFKMGSSRPAPKTHLSDEEKARRRASRERNKELRAEFDNQYNGSRDFGHDYGYADGRYTGSVIDYSKQNAEMRDRHQQMRDNNLRSPVGGWFTSGLRNGMNEGFLRDKFNDIKGRYADNKMEKEIQAIHANIRNIKTVEEAQSAIATLTKYLQVYQERLADAQAKQGKIMDKHSVVDRNADNKKNYNNAWRRYKNQANKKNPTTFDPSSLANAGLSPAQQAQIAESIMKKIKNLY